MGDFGYYTELRCFFIWFGSTAHLHAFIGKTMVFSVKNAYICTAKKRKHKTNKA